MRFKINYLILLLILCLSACKISKKDESTLQEEDANSLKTLPYASFVSADDKQAEGIKIFNKDKIADGYNFFCRRNQSYVCLYDMNGTCVKKWGYEAGNNLQWQYADIDEKGNVVFIVKPEEESLGPDGSKIVSNALGKLDPNNNLIWYKKGRFHHDFIFLDNDEIATFARKERIVSWRGQKLPILDDKILFLNASTGEIKREYSIYDIVGEKFIDEEDVEKLKQRPDYAEIFQKVSSGNIRDDEIVLNHDRGGDVFHTNSILRIPRPIKGVADVGDFLISIRQPNFVGIVKSDMSGVKWFVKDIFKKQHQPILLANNNFMVFDNKWIKGYSRVAEIDPLTKSVVWQYNSERKPKLYSATRGGVQELKNGNILVVDSSHGKLLEVTRNKEIVWQYVTSSEMKNGRKVRPVIYRAKRFSTEDLRKIFPNGEF